MYFNIAKMEKSAITETLRDTFFKCGSLGDFPFFKVECKKQGKSLNAYISTTIDLYLGQS